MHKNAIKIVWGVKNCAPFTKNMALFGGKKFVRLFVRFLAELGAPLSSELLTTLTESYRARVRVCQFSSEECFDFKFRIENQTKKMATSLAAAGVQSAWQTRIEKVFLTTRNITCEYGQNCYRKKPEHLRYKTHAHCKF